MKTLYLEKSVPSRNCQRYYRLDLSPDLFGRWVLCRTWGRIGRQACEMRQSFPERAAALVALRRLYRQKCQRGYSLS